MKQTVLAERIYGIFRSMGSTRMEDGKQMLMIDESVIQPVLEIELHALTYAMELGLQYALRSPQMDATHVKRISDTLALLKEIG